MEKNRVLTLKFNNVESYRMDDAPCVHFGPFTESEAQALVNKLNMDYEGKAPDLFDAIASNGEKFYYSRSDIHPFFCIQVLTLRDAPNFPTG